MGIAAEEDGSSTKERKVASEGKSMGVPAKPFVTNGMSWTVFPRTPGLEFTEKPGELPPIWVQVENPAVAIRRGKRFTQFSNSGWVSITGVTLRVTRQSPDDSGFARDVPVNLLVEHGYEALAVAETLIDAVHQQRWHHELNGLRSSTQLQANRQIAAIALAVRQRATDAIIGLKFTEPRPDPAVPLFDPYGEIGHLGFLEDLIGEVDLSRERHSTGRRLSLAEDLAEVFVFLAYCCYYTDYRKRVELLLLEVISQVPASGGVVWSTACSTRDFINQVLGENIDSASADSSRFRERMETLDSAIVDLENSIEAKNANIAS